MQIVKQTVASLVATNGWRVRVRIWVFVLDPDIELKVEPTLLLEFVTVKIEGSNFNTGWWCER
jgi:hypothetical protein